MKASLNIKPSLLLIFSRNISLKEWEQTGLLYREKEIYEEFLKDEIFSKIYWLTYGNEADLKLLESLRIQNKIHPDINIMVKPSWWKLGNFLYSLFAPFIHSEIIKSVNFVKSNQMDGAWMGAIIKLIWPRKKFIYRSGYNLIMLLKNDGKHLKSFFHKLINYLVVQKADKLIVTSKSHQDFLETKYLKGKEHICVIGNFIDTKLFAPSQNQRNKEFVFLGRFEEVKNIDNLIDACLKTNSKLNLIGKGVLEESLKKKANDNIKFLGTFPNDKLPEVLSKFSFFVIPSLHEGNPKALLEAMSLGMVCLGSDVQGIRDIITDGENGLLITSTSATDIGNTLVKAANLSPDEILRLGKNARSYIEKNHAIEATVMKEKNFAGYVHDSNIIS